MRCSVTPPAQCRTTLPTHYNACQHDVPSVAFLPPNPLPARKCFKLLRVSKFGQDYGLPSCREVPTLQLEGKVDFFSAIPGLEQLYQPV